MSVAEAVIIAIVEGLTEFLPISSTGHMIIAEKLLGIPHDDFTKLFTVGIQFGAIMAVVVLYWKKFMTPLSSGKNNVFKHHPIETEEQISFQKAFMIGLWQCVAMIPGVSRSAASIIGGMQQHLTRKLAAEFSFFLAVPTMAAATGYKLLKGYETITTENIKLFAIGNIVAFVVAMLAIKFFIGFLQKHGFKLFGYYRIIGGVILLIMLATGYLKG